jgi:hypothetical protein
LGGFSGCPGVPWLVFDFGFSQPKPSHHAPPIPAAAFIYYQDFVWLYPLLFIQRYSEKSLTHLILASPKTETRKGRKFSAPTGSIRLKQPTPHEGIKIREIPQSD